MAFSVTTLAWGIIEYWDAYQASGELQHAIDAVKWGTDWLMKVRLASANCCILMGVCVRHVGG